MNDTKPYTTPAVVICECHTNKTASIALHHFHLALKLTLYVNLYVNSMQSSAKKRKRKKNWVNCGEICSTIKMFLYWAQTALRWASLNRAYGRLESRGHHQTFILILKNHGFFFALMSLCIKSLQCLVIIPQAEWKIKQYNFFAVQMALLTNEWTKQQMEK